MIRYIFSINTGRAGSAYLQTVFQHVVACHAFHEPAPIGNGRAMRRFLGGDPRAMRQVVESKVARIRSILTDDDRYVETNHCFIKGFGWLLPEYLPEEEIGVVILRRDPERIVESMIRVDCSPLVPTGRDWIMLPTVPDPRVSPPSRALGRSLTYHAMRIARLPFRGARYYERIGLRKPRPPTWIEAYERECVRWYIEESRAREIEYRRRFPGIRYFETDVDALNDETAVLAMLRHFGCDERPSLREALGARVNLKAGMSR